MRVHLPPAPRPAHLGSATCSSRRRRIEVRRVAARIASTRTACARLSDGCSGPPGCARRHDRATIPPSSNHLLPVRRRRRAAGAAVRDGGARQLARV
jgi:hypothetical protein